MADNVYDFDALIASGTRFVTDDGTGNDTIVLNQIRTISQTAIDAGNYAVRIFLTSPSGVAGTAYGEVMRTDPLVYTTVTWTGVIENIYGAAGRELYSGNSSRNYIQGDALDVEGGNDLINGLGGNDTLVGSGGSDRVNGDADDDLLYGDADLEQQLNIAYGDDTLDGGTGNDTLIGGFGTNQLQGGAGFDTSSYAGFLGESYVTYSVNVDLSLGQARVIGLDNLDGSTYSVAVDTVDGIERFVGTSMADVMTGVQSFVYGDLTRTVFDGGAGNDSLTGGISADELYGGHGDDVLDANLNGNLDYIADLLAGGVGNDTYLVHQAADIVEIWGQGTDTVISDTSWTLGYNLERLVLSSLAGAASATGNVLDNHLTGNSAANHLDGRGGANTLQGGAGNDTYVVQVTPALVVMDQIIETADGGTDTVLCDKSLTLNFFDNVENLVLTGTGNIDGTGNASANRITGNSGNNMLTTWTGGDTLEGGAGNDIYNLGDLNTLLIEAVGAGTDTVRIWHSYTLGENLENLTASVEGLTGTGNGLNNSMTGSAGKDTLSGMAGNDTLFGGANGDQLLGGDGNDAFRGESGNDTVSGGAGVDVLSLAGSIGVRVDLSRTSAQATGYGNDVISGIENVIGSTQYDVLKGSSANNALYGGGSDDDLGGAGGNDALYGGVGFDTLRADLGNDSLYGGSDGDTLVYDGSAALTVNLALTTAQVTGLGTDLLSSIEHVRAGAGADMIRGNSLSNQLYGGGGGDTIYGGSGTDYISGGAGNDVLYGGSGGGTDMFVFGTNDNTDQIADFENGIDAIVMGAPSQVTIQDSGANTLLIYGSTRVTLLNIDHLLITSADFLVP